MINQFESAFGALLNVQETVFGERKKATVSGLEVDAIIGELTFDEILVAGGIAENGGFEIQVAASLLPGGRPADLSPVIVAGRTLYILQPVRNANGIYTLTCGDPSSGA